MAERTNTLNDMNNNKKNYTAIGAAKGWGKEARRWREKERGKGEERRKEGKAEGYK